MAEITDKYGNVYKADKGEIRALKENSVVQKEKHHEHKKEDVENDSALLFTLLTSIILLGFIVLSLYVFIADVRGSY